MVRFRSGRAGIFSALASLLLLVLLSCVVFAAEKKPSKPEGKTPAATPSAAPNKKSQRPKPEEGIRDVPIAQGHDAKGLILPDFDLKGHLRGKLQAGVTRRLDDQNIQFESVKFVTFLPETETPNLDISVKTAVLNIKTQILTSNVRSTVKRSDFEASGDSMRFEMLTRQSTLEGNVKVVVRGKARTPGEQPQ